MATILDQNFQLGVESTYGTFATPTRAFEAKGDTWKLEQDDLPSVGMRPGMQGAYDDRLKTIIMGATGTLQFDVLTKGAGLLLQAMLGSTTGPTQLGATAAYKSTHTTATADPGISYSVQMQRVDTGDTLRAFTYLGAVVTSWKLSHSVPGLLVADIDFDARTSNTSEAAASAVSPTGAASFDWTQCAVTIDSGGGAAEFCVESVEIEADLGMKTDRRLMCSASAGLKKQPRRAAVPSFTGTLVGEFEDLTEYALFTAGTLCDIVVTWTGAEIDPNPYDYELKVTMPSCKFMGDANPEASLDDITKQPLPFKAYYDGSNPMCTVEYTSTDTAL